MTSSKSGAASAVAGMLLCACWLVSAPVLAASADVSTKGLSGKATGKGALMSREELRVCVKEQRAQQSRAAELEARGREVDAEAEAVRKQKDQVQAERDAYNAKLAQAQGFQQRVKAHGDRVSAYNVRYKAFSDAPPPKGEAFDREKASIEAEGAALTKADAELKAEAPQWTSGTMEPVRAALMEKVQAQQVAVAASNERSQALDAEVKAYESDRGAWQQRCGDRAYRIADEKVVRAER